MSPPPPHFDDNATIATARQVVPLKGVRKLGARRKVLALLALLIASTLCGAVGALAVNYLEGHEDNDASVAEQQPVPDASTQAKTEQTPVAIAPELNADDTEIQATQPENSAGTSANERPPKSEEPKIAKREDAERKSASPAATKRESTKDAAKLIRKRRVQPVDSELPLRRDRRTDAGRIEDIFTGPNP